MRYDGSVGSIGRGAAPVFLSDGGHVTELVSLALFADTFPRSRVDEVLDMTGRREQRTRLLPAHMTMPLTLATFSQLRSIQRTFSSTGSGPSRTRWGERRPGDLRLRDATMS
ncbi:transposase domain-containing protein [Actinosynnema sp. CS-041913]|uniref:transposase domain-containing protein n=1 Tax=Actinosynnema sp. CS-041913 TaxID=3239917 RepID=UPI003D947F65